MKESQLINSLWNFYRKKIWEAAAISYLVAAILFSLSVPGIAPLY